jgi:hypothetical protein
MSLTDLPTTTIPSVTTPTVSTPKVPNVEVNKGAIPTKIDVKTGSGVPGGFSAQNSIEAKSKELDKAYSSQLSKVQAQKADLLSKMNDPKYDQSVIKSKLASLNKTESSLSSLKSKAGAMANKGFSKVSGIPKVSVPKVNVPDVNLPSMDIPTVSTPNLPSVPTVKMSSI